MAMSFNKKIITEAIQEVLAEDQTVPVRVKSKKPGDQGSVEVMTKAKIDALKQTGKVEVEPMEEENMSVGHVDDEPGMLKQFAFDTADYAAKLYKLLHHYEQMEDHVDFPNWWQHKVMMAREYISKATHYLEFETMKPQIDAAVDGHSEEESLDEAIGDQIAVGNYVKTQHGHIYKRVEGTVGGRPAFVDVEADKKGKLKVGKRKTGLHDSVKLTLVNKSELDKASNEKNKSLDEELNELFGKAKGKTVNYRGDDYKILDIDNAGTFTLKHPKTGKDFYVNAKQMKDWQKSQYVEPELEDMELNIQPEDE